MKVKILTAALFLLFGGAIGAQKPEATKTVAGFYSQLCVDAKASESFGHCNLQGYNVPILTKMDESGNIHVLVNVGDGSRGYTEMLLDTGASAVSVNDLPTTKEMQGATTVETSIANGHVIKVIQNLAPVCVAVAVDVSICQKVAVNFGGADSAPLLGNSFMNTFVRTSIDREKVTITVFKQMPNSYVYLWVKGKIYIIDRWETQ
jgi:hypothetical protein